MSFKDIVKICTVSLVLFSCSKDVQESYIGQVMFTLSGDVSGRYVQFSGGIDDYYMNTQIERNFDYENKLLNIYTGTLENVGDQVNKEKIAIKIRNIVFGDSTLTWIDSLTPFKFLNYFTPTSNSYLVNFNPIIDFPGTEFTWDFGDGTIVNSTVGTITHRYINPSKDRYNVCLTASDGSACSDNICYDVVMPYATCDARIFTNSSGSPGSTNDYFFSVNASGIEPLLYDWEFEGGLKANSKSVKYAYDLNQQLIEHVKVQITDAAGCTTRLEKKINIGNFPSSCFVNFSHSTPQLDSLDYPGFGTVEVVYTDHQGVDFTTAGLSQPSTSSFEIVSYNPYVLDRNGNMTITMEVEFNCKVRDSNGSDLYLSHFIGQIAIPY